MGTVDDGRVCMLFLLMLTCRHCLARDCEVDLKKRTAVDWSDNTG